MAKRQSQSGLAAREQQIMDAIHSLGEASVGEVWDQLADPPGYSAVRSTQANRAVARFHPLAS